MKSLRFISHPTQSTRFFADQVEWFYNLLDNFPPLDVRFEYVVYMFFIPLIASYIVCWCVHPRFKASFIFSLIIIAFYILYLPLTFAADKHYSAPYWNIGKTIGFYLGIELALIVAVFIIIFFLFYFDKYTHVSDLFVKD